MNEKGKRKLDGSGKGVRENIGRGGCDPPRSKGLPCEEEDEESERVVPRNLVAQFESKGHSDPKGAAKRVASALEACNLSTFQSFKRAGLSDEEARQKATEKCKSEASKMDLLF